MSAWLVLTLGLSLSPVPIISKSVDHKHTRRILPQVFNIPRNITQTLDVDLFFSLFFVFLNEDIEEISTDFTVFAPAGLDTAEAARWLGKKEQVTQQLLLNHIVVGVHLRPELLITATGPWKTLGGHEVEVEVDNRGEFIVNGVRVLAWTKEGPALIVVLEDYLFKQEVAEDTKDSDKNLARLSDVSSENVKNNNAIEATSEFPEAKPRMTEKNCNKVGSLSIFERVTICTETVEDWEDTEMDDKEPETRTRNLPLQGLLEKVADTVFGLEQDVGPTLQQFLNFSNEVGVETSLSPWEDWTVLAPVDSAWQKWIPIDWGFNPFLVPDFLNSTLINLFVPGLFNMTESNVSWPTVSGESLHYTAKGENFFLGESLVLGWRDFPGGRLVLLEDVPGINLTTVESLEASNPDLVSSPPIQPLSPPEDWIPAFIPAALAVLSLTPDTGAMSDFLSASPSVSSHQVSSPPTLLVPTNPAFLSLCHASNSPCTSLALQPDLRLSLLEEHLAQGSLQEGRLTTNTRNITVTTHTNGSIVLEDESSLEELASVLTDPIPVSSLGTIVLIDTVIIPESMEGWEETEQEEPELNDTETDRLVQPTNTLKEKLLALDMKSFLGNLINIDDSVSFPESENTEASQPRTGLLFPLDESNVDTEMEVTGDQDKEEMVETEIEEERGEMEHEVGRRINGDRPKRRIVYINNQRVELMN